MHWSWARFEDLGVTGLYEALALRVRVFVLEQGPYQDLDGADTRCWHLRGHDDGGVLQAYLRAAEPGVKYAEASIGRVVTAPEVRGRGLGRLLMQEGLRRCALQWPGQPVRISAQARLRRFYEELGFESASEPYLEDEIEHLQMLWRPR